MKILVTGGNGQVGFELRRQLCLLGKVLAPSRQELDLSDVDEVDQWLKAHQPELIVNAAAYTAVDKAEDDRTLARRLNAELPAQLAEYSAEQGKWLVHYSSDYVYPGSGKAPWQEDDSTCPLSVYGQTKLEGDEVVQQSNCQHLIFRTSWVYGARGHNFMKTMLRLGRDRDSLRVVSDQVGAPTPARLIAQVTALALTAPKKPSCGIYHLAPRGETSWLGFAQEIFRQASAMGEELTIRPERVAEISTIEYPTPAVRPLNSRLCCRKLEEALSITLPSWQNQLTLTLSEYLDR
ncbi:dTDP-4-dehydrorhamnose reductase [Halomonas sp. DN3]|uniref:dTDP-4-dehydrorhamnose reductase n=1 Tax=Halomonas sp. DN3 TaxID=2953657 RepID=UPI0020A07DA9|nr:dTDP-4-dehydrorhamnose reductase [Halomonas sp. DN3]USZ49725.1 dTDP-4-dehydrorhamnose reductase [Halomonas sp. DN3]